VRMRGGIGEQSEYLEDEGGGGGDALSASIGSTESALPGGAPGDRAGSCEGGG
jgi:hypothetical protein